MIEHRLLDAAGFHRMPWRNGAGASTEIAGYPHGSGYEFDWRASIAEVERAGPFSGFDGVDRTLVVLEGDGLHLSGTLDADVPGPFVLYRFAGEDRVECTPVGGPVRAFNLMVRRNRARGDLQVVAGAPRMLDAARFLVCYAAAGNSACRLDGRVIAEVPPGSAMVADAGPGERASWEIVPIDAGAVALAAAIDPVQPS